MNAPDQTEEVRDLLDAGDLAAAYDAAMSTIEDGADVPRLRYLAVLALARMGATEQAREAYASLSVAEIGDADALALDARLLKDEAFAAAPAERPQALRRAAQAYRAVWEETGDPFPAANAATLLLLAGDEVAALRIAGRLLAHPALKQPASYYDAATLAEMLLLLANRSEAEGALRQAVALPGADPGARATTRRQLVRLCAALELSGQATAALLAPLAPGTVIHFCGRMFAADAATEADLRTRIDRELAERSVIAGYGALACGADILVAEALLRRGAELHVILASSPQAFAATSVLPGGADWRPRYEACLAVARSLRLVGDDSYADDPSSFGFSTEVAMGLAATRARNLGADLHQLAIDGDRAQAAGDGPAGTQADIAAWRSAGRQTTLIEAGRLPAVAAAPKQPAPPQSLAARRAVSLLFSDFARFTGLAENELPRFWEEVLGAAAGALDCAAGAVIYRNTWGDAVFAAFTDPLSAAEAALAMQERIASAWPAPVGGGMRISLHHGLAFVGNDPVLHRASVYGREVSRAARIEPITPPGTIYVSEIFAAAVNAHAAHPFRFGYLGRLALPKRFGVERLYRLTRQTSVQAPSSASSM